MILRTLAMAIGLLFATVSSQFPEFAQQYRQRLGGAIDELQRIVVRFDQDAKDSGLTREQALTRMRTGADDFVRRRGISEAETIGRFERLARHRTELDNAGAFGRVTSFLRYGDAELTERTYRDFEPAVPVTWEGFAAAFVGFVLGWGVMRLIAVPIHRASFRRRLRRANAA